MAAMLVLKKLHSATEAGLSYSDYSKRVVDAKVEIDGVVDEITEVRVKKGIRESLQAFLDAREFWQIAIRDSDRHGILYLSEGDKRRFSQYEIVYSSDGTFTTKESVASFWRYGTKKLGEAAGFAQEAISAR
jgi:hypothetical protein